MKLTLKKMKIKQNYRNLKLKWKKKYENDIKKYEKMIYL